MEKGSQLRQPHAVLDLPSRRWKALKIERLLNLANEVPAAAAQAHRIAEVVDADEARRRAGRNRFRHYRDRGLTPETHNLAAEEAPLPL